jgi:2-hydroxy-6-oxonona-2,4-dienedioate hydrolase
MQRIRLAGLVSALAATLAGASTYALYRRDMKGVRAALDQGSLQALTDHGPIEYGREGSGTSVLVVHGAGGGYDQGLFVGREMFGAGFDLIAPSRFGYLKTPVPKLASPADQADAHVALLDSLDVRQAIVLGISAGAPSAVEMALRHPERVSALILAVPRAYAPGAAEVRAPFESEAVLSAVMKGADFSFWCAMRFARASIVRFLGVPPELESSASVGDRARVTAVIRSILPLSRRVTGIRNDGEAKLGPLPLGRITAPTLVISAEDDLYGTLPPARYVAGQIPGAELMVLPSGGHLMVGRGDEVRARIRSFAERAARRLADAA